MSNRRCAGLIVLLCGALALALPAGAQAQSPSADLSIAKSDSPDPVFAGADLTYTIVVANGGPGALGLAASPSWNDALLPGVTFVSLTQTTSLTTWSCSTPAVGDGGSVFCTLDSGVVSFGFTGNLFWRAARSLFAAGRVTIPTPFRGHAPGAPGALAVRELALAA